MRKLNTQDVFKLARFIKKTGLKHDITNLFSLGSKLNPDDDAGKKELGIEAFFIIIEKAAGENVESEFYSLLSGVAEKDPEDIKNLSLESMAELLTQIAKENNIATFFKAAHQLATK